MMRFGKLLAEGSPEALLEKYSKPNLEDVFLSLCMQDGDLETARTRERRKSRPDIIKSKTKSKQTEAENNKLTEDPLIAKMENEKDVKIVRNGSVKHNIITMTKSK